MKVVVKRCLCCCQGGAAGTTRGPHQSLVQHWSGGTWETNGCWWHFFCFSFGNWSFFFPFSIFAFELRPKPSSCNFVCSCVYSTYFFLLQWNFIRFQDLGHPSFLYKIYFPLWSTCCIPFQSEIAPPPVPANRG